VRLKVGAAEGAGCWPNPFPPNSPPAVAGAAAGVVDCEAAVLVVVDEGFPKPPPKRPPPVLAGVEEVPPSKLGFAPNKLLVEGTGAAGVVDPKRPPGFEVCCPAVAPNRLDD
jgi:hypothetical protein